MKIQNIFITGLSLLLPLALVSAQNQQAEFTGNVFGRGEANFSEGKILGVVPKGTKAEVLQVRQTERGFALQVKINDVPEIKEGQGYVKSGDTVWVYHRNRQPWMKFTDPDGKPTKDPLEALYSQATINGSATSRPTYDEEKPLVVVDAAAMIRESIMRIEKANQAVQDARTPNPTATRTELCTSCVAQSFDLGLSAHPIEQKMRGEALVAMDECNQNQGMHTSYVEKVTTQGLQLAACNKQQKIAKALAEFMNKNLNFCAQEALRATGSLKEIKKIHLKHAGIIGDVSHTSRSLHSVLRAIDVKELELTLNDNSKTSFTVSDGWKALQARRRKASPAENEQKTVDFYTQFRSCWAEKLLEQNSCQNNGKSRTKGSLGWEDPDHHEHLHLSVPYCPANNGFYGS